MPRPRPHRTALALTGALTGLALAVAGCGGSGSSPATAPTTPPMTKAEARSLATSLNLVHGDVPGYRASKHDNSTSPAEKAADAKLTKCAGGMPDSAKLADVSSPDFDAGTGLAMHELSSDVTVLRSAALVRKDFAAVSSGKAMSCFRPYLRTAAASGLPHGVRVLDTSITRLHPASAGTDGAFGYRMRVVIGTSTLQVPVYLDVVGFAYGAAEVTLTTMSMQRSFDAGAERQLLATLVERAHRSTLT